MRRMNPDQADRSSALRACSLKEPRTMLLATPSGRYRRLDCHPAAAERLRGTRVAGLLLALPHGHPPGRETRSRHSLRSCGMTAGREERPEGVAKVFSAAGARRTDRPRSDPPDPRGHPPHPVTPRHCGPPCPAGAKMRTPHFTEVRRAPAWRSCITYHSASRSSACASYTTPSLIVHFTPPCPSRSPFGRIP